MTLFPSWAKIDKWNGIKFKFNTKMSMELSQDNRIKAQKCCGIVKLGGCCLAFATMAFISVLCTHTLIHSHKWQVFISVQVCVCVCLSVCGSPFLPSFIASATILISLMDIDLSANNNSDSNNKISHWTEKIIKTTTKPSKKRIIDFFIVIATQ